MTMVAAAGVAAGVGTGGRGRFGETPSLLRGDELATAEEGGGVTTVGTRGVARRGVFGEARGGVAVLAVSLAGGRTGETVVPRVVAGEGESCRRGGGVVRATGLDVATDTGLSSPVL